MNSLSNKTILVTGSSGFVGSKLVSRLIHDGVNVICLPRNQELKCDDKIDILFHLGAFTPKTPKMANSIDDIYRSNIMATHSLLQSLPNIPERIVFSSTLDVYAISDNDATTEMSKVDPPSLYGSSKLFCEKLITTFAMQNNCKYSILRYGNIYGPGEAAYAKLIPQTIRAILSNISPNIHGNPNALRDFVYIDDVIEATIRSVTHVTDSIEPLNIVSGTSYSVEFFVRKIIEIFNSTISINYTDQNILGISRSFNNSRMLDLLGKWNQIAINDGLQKEIEYFKLIGGYDE